MAFCSLHGLFLKTVPTLYVSTNQVIQFLISPLIFAVFRLFYFRKFDRYVRTSYCGLNLHFLVDEEGEDPATCSLSLLSPLGWEIFLYYMPTSKVNCLFLDIKV